MKKELELDKLLNAPV